MALGHYLFCPGGARPAGFRFCGGVVSVGSEAGADSGGSGGSFSTTGGLVAEAVGIVTVGAAADGGATGAVVSGAGLVSDCAGRSPSLSTTVMDPTPTSSGYGSGERRNLFSLRLRLRSYVRDREQRLPKPCELLRAPAPGYFALLGRE